MDASNEVIWVGGCAAGCADVAEHGHSRCVLWGRTKKKQSSRIMFCSSNNPVYCARCRWRSGGLWQGRVTNEGQVETTQEGIPKEHGGVPTCAPPLLRPSLRRRNGRALQEPKLTTHSIVKVPRRSVAITHRTASRCVQQVLPPPVLHPSISEGSRCCGVRPSRGLPLRFLGRHTQLEAVLHGSVRQPAAELRRPQAMSGLSPAATSLASIF